jgi:translocation and assembly module TamB
MQPMLASVADDDISLKNFALQLDKDSLIEADFSLTHQEMHGNVSIQKFSLELARLAGVDLPVSAEVDGVLKISGPPLDPEASLDLDIKDIHIASTSKMDLEKGHAKINARLKEKRAHLSATLIQPEIGDLNIQGNLPIRIEEEPLKFHLPPDTAVDGTAKGKFDLAFINDIISGDGHQVKGQLDLRGQVTGTLEKINASGEVSLEQGYYENLNYGTLLNPVDLVIKGNSEKIIIDKLEASTPENGKVSAQGVIELLPDGNIVADISLTTKKAQIVAIDTVTGSVTSDLQFSGPLRNALLKGTIRLNQLEVFIPENLPPNVVVLDVENDYKNNQDAKQPQSEDSESKDKPVVTRLDLEIQAPGQVYVRGRGLNTELEGNFKVTGTSIKPIVDGNLKMRRGTLNVLNRQFNFSRGVVMLDGVPRQEPTLDFKADAKPVPDAKMAVLVTGEVSSPKISLWSDPELPQDEILSRILFGKSAGAITPVEALELTASVATLSGSGAGPGLLDSVRNSLGLDTLKFSNDDEQTGPGVEAGRYIADGVYLGVEQGLGEGSSNATIEVEVTPNITIESDIGSDSQSRLGINMEWDY